MNEAHYRDLLQMLRERGYRSASFHDFEVSRADLILRHDIDLSLDLAMRMGAVDAELGWRATFFVLLASEFYNPASADGRAALRALRAQGHEIGLHFDAAVYTDDVYRDDVYTDDDAMLAAAAARECAVLTEIIDAPVRVTAFHRPSTCHPRFLGMAGPFAGLPHAYEPRFFTDAAYVSDGAGYWSHGAPLDHAAVTQRRGMQLLTHPYLWLLPGADRDTKITHFLQGRQQRLRAEAARNFRGYPG